MGWAELIAEGRRHRGAVTRTCAIACGISGEAFARRARREHWPEPFLGVRLLPGADWDATTATVAAYLSVRDYRGRAPWAAAVAGGSAALLLGMADRPPARPQLILPWERRVPRRPGIELWQTATMDPDRHLTVRDRVPCTTPARTLVDLAGTQPLQRLRSLAIDGRHRGKLRIPALGALLEELPTNIAGRENALQVVEDLTGDGSDSGFELTTRHRMHLLGMRPDPGQKSIQTRTGLRRLDIPFSPLLLAVECLGWQYHHDRLQLDRDALRHNAIAALDEWLILHLTWGMLFEPLWSQFVGTLREAMALRADRLGVARDAI